MIDLRKGGQAQASATVSRLAPAVAEVDSAGGVHGLLAAPAERSERYRVVAHLRRADEAEAAPEPGVGTAPEAVAELTPDTAAEPEPKTADEPAPEADGAAEADGEIESQSAIDDLGAGPDWASALWPGSLDAESSDEDPFDLFEDPATELWPSSTNLVAFGVPYWLAASTVIVVLTLAVALTLFFVA